MIRANNRSDFYSRKVIQVSPVSFWEICLVLVILSNKIKNWCYQYGITDDKCIFWIIIGHCVIGVMEKDWVKAGLSRLIGFKEASIDKSSVLVSIHN